MSAVAVTEADVKETAPPTRFLANSGNSNRLFRSIVRQAERDADSLVGRLRAGTIAVFSIREAGQRSLDPRVIFMTGGWSERPAHSLVPAVIAAVWSRALAR